MNPIISRVLLLGNSHFPCFSRLSQLTSLLMLQCPSPGAIFLMTSYAKGWTTPVGMTLCYNVWMMNVKSWLLATTGFLWWLFNTYMTLWEKSKLEACSNVETKINTMFLSCFFTELLYVVHLLLIHKACIYIFIIKHYQRRLIRIKIFVILYIVT